MATSEKIYASLAYVQEMFKRLAKYMPFVKNKTSGVKGTSVVQNDTASTLETYSTNEIAMGTWNKSDKDHQNTLLTVGVGSDASNRKNAIEVTRNGELFILYPATAGGEGLSLQKYIDDKSTITVKNYSAAAKYIKSDCYGKVIILDESEPGHKAGLYMVTMEILAGGRASAVLTRIAEVPADADTWAQAAADLTKRMDTLENKVLEVANMERIPESDLTKEQLEKPIIK